VQSSESCHSACLVLEFLSELCGNLEGKFRLQKWLQHRSFSGSSNSKGIAFLTVFRNVGYYLHFYRISQAIRIQAPFPYNQLIWLSQTAAQTVCFSKWNFVITGYQHCLTCYKVLYTVVLGWICDFVADTPCMPAASSKINSKHFTSQCNSVLRASVRRNGCWLQGDPSVGGVVCLT